MSQPNSRTYPPNSRTYLPQTTLYPQPKPQSLIPDIYQLYSFIFIIIIFVKFFERNQTAQLHPGYFPTIFICYHHHFLFFERKQNRTASSQIFTCDSVIYFEEELP